LAEGLAADVNYGWALCPDCKPSMAVARAGAAGACEPGAVPGVEATYRVQR